MKPRVMTIGAVLLAALPLAATAQTQVPPSHQSIFEQQAPKMTVTGRPVARVNGVVLTDRDLLREMYTIFPYARQHNGGFPKAMEADIRGGALKMIEFEELVYQETQRRKMTVAPARLDTAEQEMRKHFASPEQYQDFLRVEAQGSRKVLREKIRRSMLIERFMKLEVADKSAVTLAETKAYYDKNPDKFRVPETYTMQTITMMSPQKATAKQVEETRKRAEAALKQAKATKDYESFGMLAEKISEDDFRVMMGDHKTVSTDRLPAQILEPLKKMQPGQVSEVVQVEQAFTVIRLNAHSEAHLEKYSEVRDRLRGELRQNKVEKLRSGWNQQLRKNAKIEEL